MPPEKQNVRIFVILFNLIGQVRLILRRVQPEPQVVPAVILTTFFHDRKIMHPTTCYQYAFLDSGIGGLPYLSQLLDAAPGSSCVYLADTLHFPYGEKTRDDIIQYALDSVQKLLEHFNPQVIIVACNTMSVVALGALRQRFPVPFVGTVPAIKLAAEHSRNRRIGLLATERTVTDPYTDELIQRFADDCHVERIGDSTLVAAIEHTLIGADQAQRLSAVRPSMERFRRAGVDTVVLACTHFLHVIDEIHEASGPQIHVIDSRNGVIQQALRLAPPAGNVCGCRSVCHITGGIDESIVNRYKALCGHFDIDWEGIL